MTKKRCPLGEACDLTTAWMAGAAKAKDRIMELEVKLAKAVEALEALIQQTHNCEKELTEDLHHMDFCGESEPLTRARTTLAELKGRDDE